jgi:MFS family permease
MRGRVMALYMAVLMGGTPFGAPLVGFVAETFGPRWSLIAGGLISAGAAIIAALLLARREGLQVRGELIHLPRHRVRAESLADRAQQA